MSEENTQEVAQETAQEVTQEAAESSSLISANDGWYLSEGVKGEGDAPEWFDSKRFKSVDQQAKSYLELEKKFGAHRGAPKDGYAIPVGFDGEDELVKQAIERAGKHNINQEAFNDIFELVSASAGVGQEVTVEGEIAKLGENASERIKTVETFLKNNAGDKFGEFESLLTTAQSVELVEKMITVLAPGKMPLTPATGAGGMEWSEIEKAMNVKAENGRLLRSEDPAYNAKVDKMIADYYGEEGHVAYRNQ